MMRAAPLLLLVTLSLSSTACAGNRTPDVVEDAAAYALSDRSRAAMLLEHAVPEASTRDRPTVQLYAGEHRRLLGEHAAARRWFETIEADNSRHSNQDAAQAGLLLIEAANHVDPIVLARLRRLRENDLLDSQNADRFMVLAIVAAAEGDDRAFEHAKSKAIAYAAGSPMHSERIISRLGGLVVANESTTLSADYALEQDDSPIVERIDAALTTGDVRKAQSLIERARRDAPGAEQVRELDYLERRLSATAVNPDVIGVLLPLSGRYASVGSQVRQAIEYGFSQGGGRGRLVVVDSGTTADSAVAAAERLVFDEGAIAIAGPLLSDQADALAAAMDAMRTPLIGLSQSLEPGPDQEWVYRAAVSVADQVEALVDYTVNDADIRTYGIFAPDNDYGRGAARAFKAATARHGATVVAEEYYDPASNDMTAAARRLSPKSGYGALFIPDTASRVPLACAGLAYEEFPVGTFQPVPGGPTIRLLGLNSWNNEDLLTQGGAYVRDALFTELFVSDTSVGSAFETAYRAEYGRTPSPLEAVVSDIGRLAAAATQAGAVDRSGFLDAMASVSSEGAVTGTNGFDPDTRTARHDLRILTITRDSIVVVE